MCKKAIAILKNNNGIKLIKKLISVITECDSNKIIYKGYYDDLNQTF